MSSQRLIHTDHAFSIFHLTSSTNRSPTGTCEFVEWLRKVSGVSDGSMKPSRLRNYTTTGLHVQNMRRLTRMQGRPPLGRLVLGANPKTRMAREAIRNGLPPKMITKMNHPLPHTLFWKRNRRHLQMHGLHKLSRQLQIHLPVRLLHLLHLPLMESQLYSPYHKSQILVNQSLALGKRRPPTLMQRRLLSR